MFFDHYRLLENNMNVNIEHQLGWTPLMVAAVNGKLEICKILLEAGADPNLTDKFANPNRTGKELGMHSLEGIYKHKCKSI